MTTTDFDTELVSAPGAIDTIAALAGLAVEPTELEPGKRYAFVVPEGASVREVNLDLDEFRAAPRRKKGTTVVHDAPSFVGYLDKHGLPNTEVFADLRQHRLVAVINANSEADLDGETIVGEGTAGWGDHRVSLGVAFTPGWAAWSRYDGQMLPQVAFAEHVEARLIDFTSPDGATMLELAQFFEGNRTVEWKSGQKLQSSETKLQYEETLQVRSGQRGDIDIPNTFRIAVEIFEGSGELDVFDARFRYRIGQDGKLSLGYALERPEDVVRKAFLDLVVKVEDAIDATVYRGVPAV